MPVSSPPTLPTPGHEPVGVRCPVGLQPMDWIRGESRDPPIRRSCGRKVDPSLRWGSIQYYPPSRTTLFLSSANSDQVAPSTSIVIASESEAISGRRALDRSRLHRRTRAPRNDSANLVEICF